MPSTASLQPPTSNLQHLEPARRVPHAPLLRVGLLTFPSYRWRPAGSFPHKRPPAASAQAHARRGFRFSEGAPSFMRGKERLRIFCVPMLCIGKRSGKARPIKKMSFSAGPCPGRVPHAPNSRVGLLTFASYRWRPRRLFSPLPQVVAVSLRRKCSSGLSRITRKT